MKISTKGRYALRMLVELARHQESGYMSLKEISERQNIAASYKAQGDAEAQKIRNDTDRQVAVMKAEAEKQAEITVADGEAEYMRTIAEAYNTPDKEAFYRFLRGLDALKESLSGDEKTIILDKDSELVKLLYGEGLD